VSGFKSICDRCTLREAMHSTIIQGSYSNYCCKCYMDGGGIADDWHPECMKALADQQKQAP